jgi:hypothetical protein
MYIITRNEDIKIRLDVKRYKTLPPGSEINIYGPIPFEFLEKEYIFRTARERGYKLMSRDAWEMYYLILNEVC